MSIGKLKLIVVIALFSPLVLAADIGMSLRGLGQDLTSSHSDIFPVEDSRLLFTAFDLDAQTQGFRFAATANFTDFADSSDFDLEISEAFYDFSAADWLLSVGKKKLDWDVGYGFRPLDMFSPTDSLAVYVAVPPGALMLQGDYFTEQGNISLLCNETLSDYLERGRKVKASLGCGGRYYHYFDNFEGQLVAHLDEDLGIRLGASALTVLGDSLELHTSMLWQQKYRSPAYLPQRINQPNALPLVETQWQKAAVIALAGLNYSFDVGLTVIAEYWYDGRAPSDRQWQGLLDDKSELRGSPQITYLKSHFATQNLYQHNVMLHFQTAKSRWQPLLTMVFNPTDKSMFIDGKLCFNQALGHQLCAGARQYSGNDRSIYRQLDYEQTLYLSMEIKL